MPIQLATWTSDISPGGTPDPDEPLLEARTLGDFLVAEDDDVVLGYIRLNQPGPLPSHAHALVVDGLAVHPDHQSRGIGGLLVDAGLRQALERGALKVSLRVLAPNERARSLYEHCGFVVEGVLRGEFFLNGQYVDDVFMARRLDGGSVSART